jgi:hypothetical protein
MSKDVHGENIRKKTLPDKPSVPFLLIRSPVAIPGDDVVRPESHESLLSNSD